jgi:hypothetical protein
MSDQLDYRKVAAEKYRQHLEMKKKEEEEKNRIAAEMLAEEMRINEEKEIQQRIEELKIKDDTETIDFFMDDLDVSVISLRESTDIFLDLQLMESKLETIIELVKEYGRLPDIQEKIVSLVEVLNNIFEDKKNKSTVYVDKLNKIVQNIFKVAEVEIPVELMDTTEDEDVARKLQDEMYKLT